MNLEFYKEKKILLTGHTGFKGAWMLVLLKEIGAKVYGMSLPAEVDSLYEQIDGATLCEGEAFIDIRDRAAVFRHINFWEPDVIIHMAAQAIVQESYAQPLYTFQVNVEGAINVLEAVRMLQKPTLTLWVTTDKVYKNNDEGVAFVETDPLGGNDPYAASKAAMEIALESYQQSFLQDSEHLSVVLRAGNVIGGGDNAAYRLLPDIIRAWEQEQKVIIRNPKSIRPWQHVVEPLFSYLKLGEKVAEGKVDTAEAFNIAPQKDQAISVEEVMGIAQEYLPKLDWVHEEVKDLGKEAQILKLNVDKLHSVLPGMKTLTAKEAVRWTLEWYTNKKTDALTKCQQQIQQYKS